MATDNSKPMSAHDFMTDPALRPLRREYHAAIHEKLNQVSLGVKSGELVAPSQVDAAMRGLEAIMNQLMMNEFSDELTGSHTFNQRMSLAQILYREKASTFRHMTALARQATLRAIIRAGALDPDWLDLNGHSVLLSACAAGAPLAELKLLLNGGCDPSRADSRGLTPMVACLRGRDTLNYQALYLLVQKGADPRGRCADGATILHEICRYAGMEKKHNCISMLIDAGADVMAANDQGNTPLHIAAARDHDHTIDLLLDRGAVIDACNLAGDTPLHLSAGCFRNADTLLKRGAAHHLTNAAGRSPLHAACLLADATMIQALLEKGAKIDITDNDDVTPLGYAVPADTYAVYRKERPDCVHLMLAAGADPALGGQPEGRPKEQGYNTLLRIIKTCEDDGMVRKALERHHLDLEYRDKDGRTALHVAATHDYTDIATLLLAHGADLHAKDNQGHTPLWWATRHFTTDKDLTVDLLLDAGADPKTEEDQGADMLFNALGRGKLKILSRLLDAGADPDSRDDKVDPLMFSVVRESRQVSVFIDNKTSLQLLLEAGADIHARNPKGDTILHALCHNGHLALRGAAPDDPAYRNMDLLLRAGADFNACNQSGDTPLMQAVQQENSLLAKALLARGANPELAHDAGISPLEATLKTGQLQSDTLPCLLAHGASPDRPFKDGTTPLAYVVQCYRTAPQQRHAHGLALRHLLAAGADLRCLDQTLLPALLRLCIVAPDDSPSAEAIAALLASDAVDIDALLLDITRPDKPAQWNALHYAAKADNNDVLKQLLLGGADPNMPDSDGRSPLYHVMKGMGLHVDALELLMEMGAVPDTSAWEALLDEYDTPRHETPDRQRAVLHRLLEHGFPAAMATDDQTLLHRLISKDAPKDDIRMVLESGERLAHDRDNARKTALHHAAGRENIHAGLTTLLLEYGADVNAKDENGDTPLHALCEKYSEMNLGYAQCMAPKVEPAIKRIRRNIELLLEAGADPTLTNHRSTSPADVLSELVARRPSLADEVAALGPLNSQTTGPGADDTLGAHPERIARVA